MEIKNKNSYPIYFKANTSNMDAFRPQPNNGCIAPYGMVSVNVQFYDSARPLRRHEEVIVFTSVKPFEEYALYKEQICPYCMEPFSFSKHHSHKKYNHAESYPADQEYRSYKKNGKAPKYTAENHADSKTSEEDVFAKKYKAPSKQKHKTEYEKQFEPKPMFIQEKDRSHKKLAHAENNNEDQEHRSYKKNGKAPKYTSENHTDSKTSEEDVFAQKYKPPSKQKHETGYGEEQSEPKTMLMREKKDTKKTQDEIFDKDYTKQKNKQETTKNAQTPRKVISDEKMNNRRNHNIEETMYMDRCHELKEICIHAFVHAPSAGDCKCGNCVELGIDKGGAMKLERYLSSEEPKDKRRIASEEHIPEKRFYKTAKEHIPEPKLYKTVKEIYEPRSAKDERKGKAKEAHILTRILSVEDNKVTHSEGNKVTHSDTEISEQSSRDMKQMLPRGTKIISEHDYKKRKEKLKRNLQKRYEEENESTTTKDSSTTEDLRKEDDKQVTKIGRKPTLIVLDEKCNTILRLSWTTLFLLILVLFVAVGGIYFCYNSGGKDRVDTVPCISYFFE